MTGQLDTSLSPKAIRSAAVMAENIRYRVFEHVMANNGGYLSQACSAAEILATLYTVANLAPLDSPKVPEPFKQVPGKNAVYLNVEIFTEKWAQTATESWCLPPITPLLFTPHLLKLAV